MSLETFSSVKRLDFSLHTFSRVAWVSDRARRAWEPSLIKIIQAGPYIFAHAIRAGLYRCGTFTLHSGKVSELQRVLNDNLGLELVILEDQSSRTRVVIGDAESVQTFESGWKEEESDLLFELLNVPDCCRQFHRQVKGAWSLTDPVLAQAMNTPGSLLEEHVVQLKNPGPLNTLLNRLGFQLLSYDPCSMECAESRELAEGWMQVGRENGYADEMDALTEFLSLPVEWCALHGITEIKTPLLKISSNTDPLAETYRVQLLSDYYPAEGATGLHFPYQPPRFAKITDSESFKKGLTNPIPIVESAANHSSESDEGLANGVAEDAAVDEGNSSLEPITIDLKDLSSSMSSGTIDPDAKETKSATGAPLQVRPRSSVILDETFELLKQMGRVDGRRIAAIHLTNYFNIVQLDDGSVGSCMNYYWFKSLRATQGELERLNVRLSADPLLLSYLFEEGEPDLLQLSLKACLVSALSRELLRQPEHETFTVGTEFDVTLFAQTRSAVVIGYGGYMDYILRGTGAEKIHISDLGYYNRMERIEKALDYYRERFPQKQITISDGWDTAERLAEADLVSITGSALCTGTMDELLEWSQNCKTVIVQGQSGAIYPEALFKRGVTMVSATVKPDNFIDLAVNDNAEWRALLEGKLKAVYLRTR